MATCSHFFDKYDKKMVAPLGDTRLWKNGGGF